MTPARSRLTLTVAACAALAGCTVGPDHEAPDLSAQTPGSWLTEAPSSATADVASWWLLLEDAELSELIDRAMAGSLELEETRERIVSARARRGIANADRLPTVDAEAFYERLQNGDESFVLNGPPPGGELDLFSLGAVAGWELDLWGRVARLVEAADAEIELAVEDFRAARVALAAEVGRELVTIRALDREIALVAATVDSDRDTLDIARAREDAGFGDALDVARAERVLQANDALLPRLRADRREAELRLAVLLGERPGAVSVVGAGLPRRDVLPDRGAPADLLLRRPDLRRAERELAAATARIGARQAEWYPRVSISGSIALQGPDIGDAINPQAYVLRLAPTISVPIFEAGRIRSRVLEAESDQRRALLRLQAAALGAFAEVETATMRRERAEERVDRLRAAELAATEAEELSLDRYTAGAVDFLDVTEARAQRLTIERERVVAERDALLRLVDLYTALGGGWDAPQRAREEMAVRAP